MTVSFNLPPGGMGPLDPTDIRTDDERSDEYVGYCPACGNPIDYCQGHGEVGDPAGRAILDAHDNDDHSGCHPDGCEVAFDAVYTNRPAIERYGTPEHEAWLIEMERNEP
jgi:hypothetical protein